MSILQRMGAAFRSWVLTDYFTPDNPLFDTPTKSGVIVTPTNAVKVAAVIACCRVLAESVASLSLITYQRQKRGKERATEHKAYRILHDKANQYQTAYVFREIMMYQALLWKGAYAVIRWDRDGFLSEVVPLHPGMTVPMKDNSGKLWYSTVIDGKNYVLAYEEVLFIPGISMQNYVTESVLSMAKNSIALSMAAEDFGTEFFASGAKPSGVLTTEQRLTDDAYARLKASWNDSAKNKAGGTKILEQGLEFQQVTMQNDQAQYIETRKHQRAEIAAIFRVPPHMIGDLERATFSNIEQQSIEFVTHSLRPWLVKWEQEINSKLFSPKEQVKIFAEFSIDSLLRGDIKSRYEAYRIGRNCGWLSENDIRETENMNTIENGDNYLVPVNMTTVDLLLKGGGNDGQKGNAPANGANGSAQP